MCRKSEWRYWLAALAILVLPAVARADDVASFLEGRGFNRLLAVHLEEQLEDLKGEARAEMALRLARLYAQLLMEADDRADRLSLETRGRQLLDAIPPGDADDLRVELLNGRYTIMEDIAERYRLRLVDLGETQHAIDMLNGIIEELEVIEKRTAKKVDGTSRSLERGTPFRATTRRQRLAVQEQLLRRSRYLLGWASYYRAWLLDDPVGAEEAEAYFSRILQLEPGSINPEHVSVDLRSEEVVAWSILGMAASRGLTRPTVTTMLWFDLLEHESVPDSIKKIVPGWRLAVLLDNLDFERASRLLDDLEADAIIAPTSWLRFAAVHALESRSSPGAQELADRAVAELAGRNALNHLYDLVERYGETLAGRDGFALAYARGVLKYQEAQELSGPDGLPATAEARRAYREAAVLLGRALEEQDREQWGAAIAGCSTLLGWSLYYDERYGDAREAFLVAEEGSEDPAREENLWMAIVCQDRLVQLGDDAARRERLSQLVERYLQEHPQGTRAGELMVRRAEAMDPTLEGVDELLAVPEEDPAWHAAQQRAAQMLYLLYSEGSGPDRLESGSRYLTLAVPLLLDDAEQAPGDPAAAGRSIARCRRVLQVALDEQLQRFVAAESGLAAIEDRDAYPMTIPAEFEHELSYRSIQLDLYADRIDEARSRVDSLIDTAPESLWTRLAIRALFKAARDRWNEAEQGDDRRLAAQHVLQYGGLILKEHVTIPEALESAGMMAVAANVAEAGLDVWERSADESVGLETLTLYGYLLASHPRNQQFLRGRAILSSNFGETDESIRCWRIILAGTSSGTEPWFEARTRLLEILEHTDPERAGRVLAQHRVLYPDWGPEPWGGRLRALHLRLGAPAGEGESP